MTDIPSSLQPAQSVDPQAHHALTAGGMALVVFVFAAVLMLDAGLKRRWWRPAPTTTSWSSARARAARCRAASSACRPAIVESQPQVALDAQGRRLVSKETVVLISLNKRGAQADKPSNVVIRGVGEVGLVLRPQIRMVQGRMFRPGAAEVIAGRSVAQRFAGAGLGETVRFGGREWRVVGRVRRRRQRLRFGDLGRRGSAHAGFPPPRVFLACCCAWPIRRASTRWRRRWRTTRASSSTSSARRSSTPTSPRRCRASSATSASRCR